MMHEDVRAGVRENVGQVGGALAPRPSPVEAQGKQIAQAEVFQKLDVGFAVQMLGHLIQSEVRRGHVWLQILLLFLTNNKLRNDAEEVRVVKRLHPSRQLGTNDCILGIDSRTYDQERVQIGDALPHLKALENFFPYFRSMNDVTSRNRFTDNEGTTHYIPGS